MEKIEFKTLVEENGFTWCNQCNTKEFKVKFAQMIL